MSCSLSVPLCSIATCVSLANDALGTAQLRRRRRSDTPALVAFRQQTASRDGHQMEGGKLSTCRAIVPFPPRRQPPRPIHLHMAAPAGCALDDCFTDSSPRTTASPGECLSRKPTLCAWPTPIGASATSAGVSPSPCAPRPCRGKPPHPPLLSTLTLRSDRALAAPQRSSHPPFHRPFHRPSQGA